MRLYDFSTLPSTYYPQLGRFDVTDGEWPQDVAYVRRLRKLGYPSAEYHGVYAADNGQLQSRAEVVRLPFRSPKGTQTVAGITAVLTHPDATGHGYGRAALSEIHRRERRQGRAWAFLWTHRTWGAHRLYEGLGYRDVFFPPSAVARIARAGRRARPRSYRLKPARRGDGALLDRLLEATTRQRFGFLPRYPGSFDLKFELGWRTPSNHLLLFRGGSAVGYAHVLSAPRVLAANEVIVSTDEDARGMVGALEFVAAGRWLSFLQTTFVTDEAEILQARGFALVPTSHLTLMGNRIGSRPNGDDLLKTFRDPRFCCHRGDVF